LAPKFDERGLLPVVTTDAGTGEVLMMGYLNEEALRKTLETGEAHYFSRSRQVLWHKGATSGFVQKVKELRIDDDQDCVWLRVETVGGANCHVGYRSWRGRWCGWRRRRCLILKRCMGMRRTRRGYEADSFDFGGGIFGSWEDDVFAGADA
jgi:phosphoribosyl-AMP cyclohydrolase